MIAEIPILDGAHLADITEPHVRSALLALVYSSETRSLHPLVATALVEEQLRQGNLTANAYSRTFALNRILTTFIHEELGRHRQVLGLHTPADSTFQDAHVAIALDARAGSQELIGWSWLYYRYVRVELALTPKTFSCMATIDERTLRRYQDHAIWRLTQCLFEREQCLREQTAKQRLYAQLPTVTSTHLIGRQTSLEHAERLLTHCQPRHMQVTGAAGIGKTAFIHRLVHALIEQGRVDQMVWINSLTSMDQLYQHVTPFLEQQGNFQSLPKPVAAEHWVIVIENVDSLQVDLARLEFLLSDLRSAIVYLSARCPLRLPSVPGYIHLAELRYSDVRHFVDHLRRNYYSEHSSEAPEHEGEQIWATAGGNPRAIQQAVQDWLLEKFAND